MLGMFGYSFLKLFYVLKNNENKKIWRTSLVPSFICSEKHIKHN